MWYFSWILGTAFACAFGILCGLWFEFRYEWKKEENNII